MVAFFKKHKSKKKSSSGFFSIRTMFILLIAILGVLGVSYASWTQQFNIFSAISTGNLNVEIRDVVLGSSSGHESISFTANKVGGIVDEVNMDVVTSSDPFSAVLVFSVENDGTIPVTCTGVDKSVENGLEVEIVEAPPIIDVGQTGLIKVRVTKGYCDDFEFSAFLEFEQAVN